MRALALTERGGGALWKVLSLRLRVAQYRRGPILILRLLPNQADHRVRRDDRLGLLLHRVPDDPAQK